MDRLYVVVPCYNEEAVLPETSRRLAEKLRTLEAAGDLDFVVSNPPFHDGGAEDRRLGQAFIRKAAELLHKGSVLWCVANRHLPYEAELNAAFKRVRMVADAGGYKLFEAVK